MRGDSSVFVSVFLVSFPDPMYDPKPKVKCESQKPESGCLEGYRCARALNWDDEAQTSYDSMGELCQRKEVCDKFAGGIKFVCSATMLLPYTLSVVISIVISA